MSGKMKFQLQLWLILFLSTFVFVFFKMGDEKTIHPIGRYFYFFGMAFGVATVIVTGLSIFAQKTILSFVGRTLLFIVLVLVVRVFLAVFNIELFGMR